MGELYACNGHYDVVHGETIEGCGTVFAPGVGRDDIYEEEVPVDPLLREDGSIDGETTDTYTFKEYCPVCDLDDVVVVAVDGIPTPDQFADRLGISI